MQHFLAVYAQVQPDAEKDYEWCSMHKTVCLSLLPKGLRWEEGGAQAGGVPVIQDYADFADVDSFQQRLDYHYIVNTGVLAGRYYIGVYNNDAYFKVRTGGADPEAGRKLTPSGLHVTHAMTQILRVDTQDSWVDDQI